MNLRVHSNFFASHNHFVGKVMQLDTDFGVQSQPAGVQDGVTRKKNIDKRLEMLKNGNEGDIKSS